MTAFDILDLFMFERVGISLSQRTAKEDTTLPFKVWFSFDLQPPPKNISGSDYFIIAIDSQEKVLKTICVYPEKDNHLFGII